MAWLPVEQRPVRRFRARTFQLAGALVAAFLALALVAVFLYSGRPINVHPSQGLRGRYLHGYPTRSTKTNLLATVIRDHVCPFGWASRPPAERLCPFGCLRRIRRRLAFVKRTVTIRPTARI